MSNKYEITVLVCTYNPDINKLIRTLASAVCQKDINIQIVIADDGSNTFPQTLIEDFFQKSSFNDYTYVKSIRNQGTIRNVLNGLKSCNGEYVKLISPGDYLYKDDSLSKWLDFSKKNNLDFSICDAIWYKSKENKIIPLDHQKVNPRNNTSFYKGMWYYNYLIFDDNATGACMLTKRDVLEHYLNIIQDKVKYGEDNCYFLMAADKLPMKYFHKDAILYECGTGISTSKEDHWQQTIKKEYFETLKLVNDRLHGNTVFEKSFYKVLRSWKYGSFARRLYHAFLIPGYFIDQLGIIFHPRYSNTNVDKNYLEFLENICDK